MNAAEGNLALFCDFENIALGVRDAKYDRFDIRPVLERLLVKGSIVVKKAYCDWDRYKEFKPAMHEAAFELIEIPHVSYSGKNSADIRMVVDALDLEELHHVRTKCLGVRLVRVFQPWHAAVGAVRWCIGDAVQHRFNIALSGRLSGSGRTGRTT